ncbi:hypothetical protein BH11PLA1_BH11PLA1_12400 [soil metagenome]
MNTITKTNESITLSIDGMTCGHCVNAVTKALSAVPGVQVRSVAVGTAQIEAKDGWAAGQAVAALGAAGYPARATDARVPVSSTPSGGCCGGASKMGVAPGTGDQAGTSKGGCCG